MIPYSRQALDDDDVQSVVDVLRSDWLTQGPTCELFEGEVAKYCSAPYAIATCNGTAALHVACLALGIGPGDTVWTTPITFVASANVAKYCGADVDFVDIDPETFNMSPRELRKKLKQAASAHKLPKALIIVHLAGLPCDLGEIAAACREYNVRLIEDASHAIGAQYQGTPIGSCQYSDATIFSFHPVKIITTAEGGMVLTRNLELARKLRRLRSHGIERDPARLARPPRGAWYYEQQELGFNYRLSDVHAALGISQLAKLDAFLSRREFIVSRYTQELGGLDIGFQKACSDRRCAWHLCIAQIVKGDRDTVFKHLRSHGIGVQVHYIPVHVQPYYQSLGFTPEQFPNSLRYYQQCLSLPVFPGLQDEQQTRVITQLRRALAL